jgi:hypothetical protein
MAQPTIISSVIVPAVAEDNAAQPYDLVTLSDVKLELLITTNVHDAWLYKVITRVSRALSTYCTRVFQAQTYQEQFFAGLDPYPCQLPSGFFPLQLSAWPLVSVPSPALTTPPLAPTLTAGGAGSLAAGTYYGRVTYVTATGETAASQETAVSVGATGSATFAAPLPDFYGIATGWNIYFGNKSYGEVKINVSPAQMNENYTVTALGGGSTTVPPYVLVVENFSENPQPLAEGVDFISDYNASIPDFSKGWLTRLFFGDNYPRKWSGIPILVQYQAGYANLPDDLQDAALQLVKARWYARGRDPQIRSENVPGAYEAQYWFGAGPGSEGDLPPSIKAMVDRYRVPTIG